MPVSFDWDFKEEEPDPSQEPRRGLRLSGQRRRWLVRGVVLLILLAVAGLAIGVWVRARLDVAQRVDAELRAVVELELRSIAAGDIDLFRSLQDPNDSRWAAWQIARYIGKPKTLAPAPGLQLVDRLPEISRVQVFGQLGEAELIHWFNAPTLSQSDPFPFRATWYYRRDDDGKWRHISPPDDASRIPFSWHSSYLVIRASKSEAEVLDPLASDLVQLVHEGCARLGCPVDVRYTLSFEGELLPRMLDDWWTLPALYLAGLPEDDEALALLQRALKLWMVEALARAQINDHDIAKRVVYRQLVKRLQSQLGLFADLADPSLPDIEQLADMLQEEKQHTLQSLWEAEYDPDDAEGMHQLENELAALVQWIEYISDREHVSVLLSALGQASSLDDALWAKFGLALPDVDAQWFAYLSGLTGVDLAPTLPSLADYEALTPPLLPRQSVLPGNQLAFICRGVIWAGNADGSRLVPLTPSGHRFNNLYWSPDGRWLLTVWQHSFDASALYLLAADGSVGRLLVDDPSLSVFPIGWSPDGREVLYFAWRMFSPWTASAIGNDTELWAVDVETEETRPLPGAPVWSPDGQKLIYISEATGGGGSSLWMADAHWENAREIFSDTQAGSRASWSPDSARLALTLPGDEPGEGAIVIFDLETESVVPLITATKLTERILSSDVDIATEDTDIALISEGPFRILRPLGWSSDGNHVVVWAQGTARGPAVIAPAALAAVPLDGSAASVLARGAGSVNGDPSWSPEDPRKLTFAWQTDYRSYYGDSAYLFDLDRGALFSAPRSGGGSWSRDGSWVAFAGLDGVRIVDQSGQLRSRLNRGDSCTDIMWNPAADLSFLGEPITFSVLSATPDWRVAHVRLHHDPFARTVYVWGEVINESGGDKRIIALVPVLRHPDGSLIDGEKWEFEPGSEDMWSAVSLDDGRGLPFGFSVRLSDDVRPAHGTEIEIHVAAEPAAPIREDLDIPDNSFDLSGWPQLLRVNGTVENPGAPLAESLTIVVTIYGKDGQVMGWGSHSETDPAQLTANEQEFEIEVEFSEPLKDWGLNVGSYKIQLFGF